MITKIKKSTSVMLAFVLVLTILLSADAFAGSKKDKLVFLGDSYFVYVTGKNGKTIPALVAKYMNAKSYLNLSKNWYGIAASGKTYQSILKKQKKDTSVTKVLIYGGVVNDCSRSKSQIQSAFTSLVKKVKSKYPKAKIYYVSCSWCRSGNNASERERSARYRNILKSRYSWYTSIAKKNGVTVLSGIEKTIRTKDADKYFTTDFNHPNGDARKAIAKAIANKLLKM